MNIIDRMMDHDKTPAMYISEYTGELTYEPGLDPLYIDYGVIDDNIILPNINGLCKIIFMSNEKDLTPRFHLFNEDGSFSCCIGFLEPVYFDNEYEHSRLDKEGKEKLQEILSNIRDGWDYTIWELGLKDWYFNNLDIQKDVSKYNMPDYTQLPD